MRSKKLLVTLIVALMLLLVGCGSSTLTEESSVPTVPNRFLSEKVEISGDAYFQFDYSCIITDTETGRQYLYIYHDGGPDGGPAMVELDTVDIVESDN